MPGALQTVDLRELIPEIGGVAGGVEGAADGLEQGRGVLHAAVFPDLLLQPAVDLRQPAGGHGGNIGYFPSYAIGSAYGAQYLRLKK